MPKVDFEVNGTTYSILVHLLTDGIYPQLAVFVTGIPNTLVDKNFTHGQDAQESVRKDVERAFGVLQA